MDARLSTLRSCRSMSRFGPRQDVIVPFVRRMIGWICLDLRRWNRVFGAVQPSSTLMRAFWMLVNWMLVRAPLYMRLEQLRAQLLTRLFGPCWNILWLCSLRRRALRVIKIPFGSKCSPLVERWQQKMNTASDGRMVCSSRHPMNLILSLKRMRVFLSFTWK